MDFLLLARVVMCKQISHDHFCGKQSLRVLVHFRLPSFLYGTMLLTLSLPGVHDYLREITHIPVLFSISLVYKWLNPQRPTCQCGLWKKLHRGAETNIAHPRRPTVSAVPSFPHPRRSTCLCGLFYPPSMPTGLTHGDLHVSVVSSFPHQRRPICQYRLLFPSCMKNGLTHSVLHVSVLKYSKSIEEQSNLFYKWLTLSLHFRRIF